MANKILSIYIGNDVIRIAELQKTNKAVVLCNAAELNTPQNSVNDGYLVDITALSEAIRSAIFGRGFTARDVIFTVQSKKIASKDVEIPYIKNESKLQSILTANSSEYFPMSNATDYCFAFSKLEDYTNEEGKKTRVSAVAAPNDLIRGYYELARDIKLNVKCVDYFGNSIIQLLSMQMDEGRMDMVLQIEKDATYVNMMRGKTLVLQRSVPYGKNAVISALMDVKKISEKDAKTLLSNETLLDQHVTADEYAEAVQYLVSGIGRVVEYHRSKNPGDALQGIKIFGEGSAIAGIEKILDRELGAPVQHFESLTGLQIKGQAALTAAEVLRYLPNVGAVINPMKLSVDMGRRESSINTDATFKFLLGVLVVAAVGMAAWAGYTYKQHSDRQATKADLEAKIEAIKDIEDLAKAYEEALLQYQIVEAFDNSTYSDNEYILDLFEAMVEIMPNRTYITEFEANEGDVQIVFKDGWFPKTKNNMADSINQLSALDFVFDFRVDEFQEDYVTLFIEGYDEETGDPIYMPVDDEDPDVTDLDMFEQYEPGMEFEDDWEEKYGHTIGLQTFVKSAYKVSFHLGKPIVVEETTEGEEKNGEGAAN